MFIVRTFCSCVTLYVLYSQVLRLCTSLLFKSFWAPQKTVKNDYLWKHKNTEWWGAGVVICLEQGADLHVAQLMPLPLTVSCFSKIQIGFTFLVPAHPGSPGKKAVKRVCVSVCVCVCVSGHLLEWVLPLGVLSALYTTMSLLFCCCYSVSTNKLKLID